MHCFLLCSVQLNDDKKRTHLRGKGRIQHTMGSLSIAVAEEEKCMVRIGPEKFQERLEALKKNLKQTYQGKRIEEIKADFREVLNNPHVPTAKERQRGVDHSAAILGLIQYGKLRGKGTNNIELLRQECQGRYKDRDLPLVKGKTACIRTDGIKNLSELIRMNEFERDPTMDKKYFKPQHTEYDDYSFDHVTKLKK
jgi:hypothetical protein